MRCERAWRNQRASAAKPNSACITANVNNSASDSFGAMPTLGRHGAGSGRAFSVSSMRAYSAVARVSRSASIRSSKIDVG